MTTVTNKHRNQRSLLLRAIYFVLIGWWAALLWMTVAYLIMPDDHRDPDRDHDAQPAPRDLHAPPELASLCVCASALSDLSPPSFLLLAGQRLRSSSDSRHRAGRPTAICKSRISSANAFLCFTPNDGWWIRFNRINGNSPTVSKGYSARYRGFHPSGPSLLAFGKDWHSSDADAVVCRSRSNGLTCKTYSGLSFWIGRYKGYRIFYDTPGEHPNVKPLFRTASGVWCGINLNNFEPALPQLPLLAPGDGAHCLRCRMASRTFNEPSGSGQGIPARPVQRPQSGAAPFRGAAGSLTVTLPRTARRQQARLSLAARTPRSSHARTEQVAASQSIVSAAS